MAHIAVGCGGIGPVRLDGNNGEAMLLDQPFGDGRAGAIELVCAVAGLAQQDDAALGEAMRSTYERVRAGRNGVAVAEARDGFCTGCHVRLPPQAYNEVRTNEMLVTCENCSRILYYVEPRERNEPNPEAQAKPSADGRHASA